MGRWSIKGIKSIYVVIEWPLTGSQYAERTLNKIEKSGEKVRGPFNNYVDRFYAFFDHLPTPRRQFIY